MQFSTFIRLKSHIQNRIKGSLIVVQHSNRLNHCIGSVLKNEKIDYLKTMRNYIRLIYFIYYVYLYMCVTLIPPPIYQFFKTIFFDLVFFFLIIINKFQVVTKKIILYVLISRKLDHSKNKIN